MNKPISGHINRRPVFSGNTEKFVNQAFTPPPCTQNDFQIIGFDWGVYSCIFANWL